MPHLERFNRERQLVFETIDRQEDKAEMVLNLSSLSYPPSYDEGVFLAFLSIRVLIECLLAFFQ